MWGRATRRAHVCVCVRLEVSKGEHLHSRMAPTRMECTSVLLHMRLQDASSLIFLVAVGTTARGKASVSSHLSSLYLITYLGFPGRDTGKSDVSGALLGRTAGWAGPPGWII